MRKNIGLPTNARNIVSLTSAQNFILPAEWVKKFFRGSRFASINWPSSFIMISYKGLVVNARIYVVIYFFLLCNKIKYNALNFESDSFTRKPKNLSTLALPHVGVAVWRKRKVILATDSYIAFTSAM